MPSDELKAVSDENITPDRRDCTIARRDAKNDPSLREDGPASGLVTPAKIPRNCASAVAADLVQEWALHSPVSRSLHERYHWQHQQPQDLPRQALRSRRSLHPAAALLSQQLLPPAPRYALHR